jgi:predicted 3-demethylubiquinone-9 3-methyltransferase (glyoxalase superfamily)
MPKIATHLWFDNQAEEATHFYVGIFKNSKVGEIRRWGKVGPGEKGAVMSTSFTLEGHEFNALNGGPHFKFTPAISLFVSCETQQEVDDLSAKLTAGGKQEQCGWVTDKYGLSWQLVPTVLGEMLKDQDPEKADRVMKAMMKMHKLDIATLKQAYEGQ